MTNEILLGVPRLKYLSCLDFFLVTIPRHKRCYVEVQNTAMISMTKDTGEGEGRKQKALFVVLTIFI